MTLNNKINDLTLSARKASVKEKDPAKKANLVQTASFLVGIQGDIKALQKAATTDGVMPEITDEMCMRALRSGLKSQQETLDIIRETSDHSRIDEIQGKIDLITSIMPVAVSEEVIRADIADILASTDNHKGIMGVIMKTLSEKYGTSLNRTMASSVAQEMTRK